MGSALLKLASISTSRVIRCTRAEINTDNKTINRHIFINPKEPVAKMMGIPE